MTEMLRIKDFSSSLKGHEQTERNKARNRCAQNTWSEHAFSKCGAVFA